MLDALEEHDFRHRTSFLLVWSFSNGSAFSWWFFGGVT